MDRAASFRTARQSTPQHVEGRQRTTADRLAARQRARMMPERQTHDEKSDNEK
jgi:hypothetical protein